MLITHFLIIHLLSLIEFIQQRDASYLKVKDQRNSSELYLLIPYTIVMIRFDKNEIIAIDYF